LLLFIYLFVIFIYLFVFLGREISEMLHCTSIKLLWDDHAMVIFDNALLGSMKFRCSNPQGGLLHKSFQFSTNTFFYTKSRRCPTVRSSISSVPTVCLICRHIACF